MKLRLIKAIANFLAKRGRKFIINDRSNPTDVYLERYYLLFKDRPRWFPINIFLHHFCRSDDHEFHDHPWPWASLILSGGYWEETPQGKTWHGAGSLRFHKAEFCHRVDLDKEKADTETWTLFVVGLKFREWGYLTPSGWISWKERVPVTHPYHQRNLKQ